MFPKFKNKGLSPLQSTLISRVGGKLPSLKHPPMPERTSMHLGAAEDVPKFQSFSTKGKSYGSS